MSRFWSRVASIVVATTLLGCSGTTEPLDNHVDFGRTLWLARRPQAYSFEVAVVAFIPTPGYLRVQVSDGQAVDVRDSSGRVIPDPTLTLDIIWDQILRARATNDLNSLRFDERGVPVEVDIGHQADDSGIHYSVRNFAATR